MGRKKITGLILLFISATSFAQDASVFKPDPVKKEVIATRITTSLKIDGLLDEAAWQLALPAPDFIQIEPFQGERAGQPTRTRVLKNLQPPPPRANIRLSWEYQPLSYVYVVFNHRGFDNALLKRQTEDHVIIKLSYLRQL